MKHGIVSENERVGSGMSVRDPSAKKRIGIDEIETEKYAVFGWFALIGAPSTRMAVRRQLDFPAT